MAIPEFDAAGELPLGVHRATMVEVLARFGWSPYRREVAGRLERVYQIGANTGFLVRCYLFGSFTTAKERPNDVDVFLFMDDGFDFDSQTGLTRICFNPAESQGYFGASVLWLRRAALLSDEAKLAEDLQRTRGKTYRGIIEIVEEGP